MTAQIGRGGRISEEKAGVKPAKIKLPAREYVGFFYKNMKIEHIHRTSNFPLLPFLPSGVGWIRGYKTPKFDVQTLYFVKNIKTY